jgi:lipopolysaccharide/colanic/teichoic acid biosynthesis glycosyltransferase
VAYRKRLFDLVLGTILAVVALPIVLMLAAVSAVTLKAWPFFVQDRIGRHGRTFKILKIRTLPTSAPAYADKYEIAASVRTPAYCEWLRRTHLDELPQLFLVPLGRMSLVGPRPEMAVLLERSDPEFVRVRNLVRPGCTGMWQVGARTDALIDEAPDYDLYYLGESSLRLDCWILWRTFAVMFLRGGSVEPTDVPAWLCGWGLIPSREFIAVVEPRFRPRTLTSTGRSLDVTCPARPSPVSAVSVSRSGVANRQPSSVAL